MKIFNSGTSSFVWWTYMTCWELTVMVYIGASSWCCAAFCLSVCCIWFFKLPPLVLYLPWTTLNTLPETAPSVYEHFWSGNFTIKDKPGRFNAVGGDQKLEQSINISSKCSDGVIWHAKRKQYLAQWDLIYHEMMAVQNLHRESSGMIKTTHGSVSHHASPRAVTNRNECYDQAMLTGAYPRGCSGYSSNPLFSIVVIFQPIILYTINPPVSDMLVPAPSTPK